MLGNWTLMLLQSLYHWECLGIPEIFFSDQKISWYIPLEVTCNYLKEQCRKL